MDQLPLAEAVGQLLEDRAVELEGDPHLIDHTLLLGGIETESIQPSPGTVTR